ncbi:MAG: VUT family protein [Pseudomonadota bacterium]
MAVIVLLSNWLVTIAINDWLTWGAFIFPFAFLVNDLTNRFLGARAARKTVIIGFIIGVLLSLQIEIRIALASACAFFTAQMLDVEIFSRLNGQKINEKKWWYAPFFSSSMASIIDTILFFSIAFVGSGLAWLGWAVGDLAVKLLVAAFALMPYRFFCNAYLR